MPKNIKQKVVINAKPSVVFNLLLDSKLHSDFTGEKAVMNRKVGAYISAYDGYMQGINLYFENNKKIVQAWHFSDWPRGHFSVVSFELKPFKADQTQIVFEQLGVPDAKAKSTEKGWLKFYWEPLNKWFEKNKPY